MRGIKYSLSIMLKMVEKGTKNENKNRIGKSTDQYWTKCQWHLYIFISKE